jgi:hypothetical protein
LILLKQHFKKEKKTRNLKVDMRIFYLFVEFLNAHTCNVIIYLYKNWRRNIINNGDTIYISYFTLIILGKIAVEVLYLIFFIIFYYLSFIWNTSVIYLFFVTLWSFKENENMKELMKMMDIFIKIINFI